MAFTRVKKYLPEGVRALQNLLNMLFEAAAACKVSAKLWVHWGNWKLIGVKLDKGKYYLYLDFKDGESLCFSTRNKIDPEAAAKLQPGYIWESKWVPGGYQWGQDVVLNSEKVHFFSRSKVRQMQWLEHFMQDCLDKARSIEIPDQPPLTEEEEET